MEPLFSLLRGIAASLLTLALTALATAAALRGGLPMMQKGAPLAGGVTTAFSALALVLLWSRKSRRFLASFPLLQLFLIFSVVVYCHLMPDDSQNPYFRREGWYSLGVLPALAIAAWSGLTEKFLDDAAALAAELGLRVVNHWYQPGRSSYQSVKRVGLAGEVSGRRLGALVYYRPDPVVEFATNLAAPSPVEMHVYEDSFGNTPLFRGVKPLEPTPWPGFCLFTNDSAEAAEFARFIALSEQDLRSLVKGASWVIGPEQVRWTNVQPRPFSELRRQMELVARAARWLEGRAKADPPAPNEV